ncbi:hypothetical protein [Virgibacillus salarius]|uniref:hypothetical protein n=1 Tax=Virgibacillus salarius TaxID=447199 RepID=UPI0031D0AD56
MSKIDVTEIANRLIELHKPIGSEEIEKLVNEKINGKVIPIDNLGGEIVKMVAELNGVIRSQDYKFMIDLLQSVVDKLDEND